MRTPALPYRSPLLTTVWALHVRLTFTFKRIMISLVLSHYSNFLNSGSLLSDIVDKACLSFLAAVLKLLLPVLTALKLYLTLALICFCFKKKNDSLNCLNAECRCYYSSLCSRSTYEEAESLTGLLSYCMFAKL